MSPRASLLPDLPRHAWLLLGGESLSAVGAGLTLPFLLVYLHDVRDLELGQAGLAMACLAAVGFAGNSLGGALGDRVGARQTLVSGLLATAAGALAFALAREPWHAFGAAALLGLGASVALPAQDALLAQLVGAEDMGCAFALRHATLNAGLGAGSVAGALLADLAVPATFELLFMLQAAGATGFAVIALRLPNTPHGAERRRRGTACGYRTVLRDGRVRRLLPVIAVLFAAGYGQYHAAFPAYAMSAGGLSTSGLGAAFAANTVTVVGAQLPVARALSSRRRSHGLALAGWTWAGAWTTVLLAADLGGGATWFCLAMVVFGLGETMLAPTLGPLVNELASEELRGRYNAASALASTTGFVVGPAMAGALLGAGLGDVLIVGLAAACVLVAGAALTLDTRPAEVAALDGLAVPEPA